MRTDRIECRISGGPPNSWKIFRHDMQIGIPRSIFDAVSFATQLAEREAVLSVAWTKVAMGASLARMHFARASLVYRHRVDGIDGFGATFLKHYGARGGYKPRQESDDPAARAGSRRHDQVAVGKHVAWLIA